MSDPRTTAFSAGLAVATADRLLRARSSTEFSSGAASGDVADAFPALSEQESAHAGLASIPSSPKRTGIQTKRFWQDSTTKLLSLAPLPFYPGIILVPADMNPPPNSKLWVRLSYVLIGQDYGFDDLGWSGGIASATATMTWDSGNLVAQNVIFPGTYSDSLPPGGTLVWHVLVGQTDAASKFTLSLDYVDTSTPLLTPPL